MQHCLICEAVIHAPIYVSTDHGSLTTMLSACAGQTEVFFCEACGHLQTRQIVDIEEYYGNVYSMLADSQEDDQLYTILDGRKVFQTEHRVNTLFEKVQIPRHAAWLDLGCAKGLVLHEVCRRRPDVRPYVYEVSQRYVHYWKEWVEPNHWATGEIPVDWKNQFDVVTSFYVLEHVDQPVAAICQQAELLRSSGIIYFIVPNVYANTADFVVADHLQHYSENSLIRLFERCGLEVVDVDDTVHESAWVAVARKVAQPQRFREPRQTVATLQRQASEMSRFWSRLSGRIRSFETAQGNGDRSCIYGAGFYGNFIASCLQNRDNIECFVDQNPYLRRKPMLGKPVVAPHELDPQITRMYVGLNPIRAREIIRSIEPWKNRHFDCFYV